MSLAAAKATISVMQERDVIAHLWEQGRGSRTAIRFWRASTAWKSSPNARVCRRIRLRFFAMSSGQESLLMKSLFMQECLKRGVLFSGVQNICLSHSSGDIDTTLRVYRSAMEILARAVAAGNVEKASKASR